MKNKHFYSHIVDAESIYIEVNKMDISEDEKNELLSIAESNIHHAIMDAILSELSEKDKRIFMEHLHSDNSQELWNLLNKKIENVEEKIKKSAEDLKKQLHKDIKES